MTPGRQPRFLLTSAGIKNTSIHDALVDLLGKPIAESNAHCIPTAMYANPDGAGHAWRFISGFRPDYRSWLPRPEAFDAHGFPIHHDGASTVVSGLCFVGVHFLRKRKSSLLIGVGEDAAIVARQIAEAHA